MRRTYLPELLYHLLKICSYVGRWRSQITRNIDAEGVTLLDAMFAACEALSTYLEGVIEHGT